MPGSVPRGRNAKVNEIEKVPSHEYNPLISNCLAAFILGLILYRSGSQI